jgi:WD40 repeat protein/serine/threonine protein kinase
LFVQVCAAVQHAHQKGVIHRDLKPSNVLVAERDGRPVPKVIDFGTAKAVGAAWNATATQFGQGMVLGTLEYMSPEQAALSADIDTSTDVYSLGVLLYELLVGRLPFDTEELRAAGYDEMRRVIRESDPPKPSARVEQRSDRSGSAARARQTDAPGLTRQLRGDLDWITLKALEKDRRRRYATVAEFAADIGRFLVDQPVEARPPSSAYRIRKFTRRHRLVVVAVASILIILGGGVAATAGLYWQAEQSRREAERQQRSADRAAAEANEQRTNAVAAQADAEIQRQNAVNAAERLQTALDESSYLAYTATLAAAASDLRNDAAPEARARLLRIPEAQRGWEWHHLFIQADESVLNLLSAVPCAWDPQKWVTTALTLDADGESILLRRCQALERWNMSSLAHTMRAAPAKTVTIVAENGRGQMLTLQPAAGTTATAVAAALRYVLVPPPITLERFSWNLMLTDGTARVAAVFGPFAFSNIPLCADISPDGRRIAIGLARGPAANRDEVYELWNATTGQQEFRLIAPSPTSRDIHRAFSCAIHFSPDGRRLATSGARVHVWDTATGAQTAVDSALAGTVSQPVAFDPRGDRLAIGRPSGLVEIMDLNQSSATLQKLTGNGFLIEESIPDADRVAQAFFRRKRAVLAVAFSPDGQTVVSGTSSHVGVWDVRQSKLVRVLAGHADDVVGVVVSADGRRIYSADAGGAVRAWLSNSGPAVVRTAGSFTNFVPLIASGDGNVIGSLTSDGAFATVRISDLHQEVIQVANVAPGFFPGISSTMSPDGLRLFVSEFDGGGVIRRETIGSTKTVSAPTYPVTPCKYVFEERGRANISPSPMTDMASKLTVSASGRLLAYIQNFCVAVWDASTMKPLAVLEHPESRPMDLVFRDEETLIVSTRGRPDLLSRIFIWNWRTNQVLGTVTPRPSVGPQDVTWGLALSPDAQRIALLSSGAQSTVSIWDRDLKTEVGRLPPGNFLALAFSSDGRRIVSVAAHETAVRVWDGERFVPLMTLSDTDSHQGGVAFTKAGQIVAGRTGGGLTIWETQIRRQ